MRSADTGGTINENNDEIGWFAIAYVTGRHSKNPSKTGKARIRPIGPGEGLPTGASGSDGIVVGIQGTTIAPPASQLPKIGV
jgi:hypothetical protein